MATVQWIDCPKYELTAQFDFGFSAVVTGHRDPRARTIGIKRFRLLFNGKPCFDFLGEPDKAGEVSHTTRSIDPHLGVRAAALYWRVLREYIVERAVTWPAQQRPRTIPPPEMLRAFDIIGCDASLPDLEMLERGRASRTATSETDEHP